MTPSKKTLQEAFRLSSSEASTLKKALVQGDKGTYSDVDEALRVADKVLGGFGVEAIDDDAAERYTRDYKPLAEYVNTGDTYNATILYDYGKDRFYVTTMGDFVESL